MVDINDVPNVRALGAVTQAAFAWFCRHLVTLDGTWQPLDENARPAGQPKPFSYPGVILAIDELWLFVTAGHTLRKIDNYLEYDNAQISGWCLRDHYGPEPVCEHPIPFNYTDAASFSVRDDDDGLAFGLVALQSNHRILLEANGIVPICEDNWVHQHKLEFDRHILLGLPEEFIEKTRVAPTMLRLTQLHNLPAGVKQTRYPRFVGKLDDKVPLDLKGMSGGPIFGFRKGCDDRYWIVAIQSGWLPTKRITFGCPVPVFADIVLRSYTDALKSLPG